jgi:hypothetical protein
MATKRKKKKGLDDLEAPSIGVSFQGFGATDGGSGGRRSLPNPTDYEPFQPTVQAYEEGTINPGEPAQQQERKALIPGAQLTTAEQRARARQGYTFDMGDINRRIMEAAMAYGNVPEVLQYGFTDQGADTTYNAAVQDNPNSVWANIGRYLTDYSRNIEEDLNNRNAFFSGAHLERKQKLNDEVSRQRLAATQDWERTLADLNSAILRSRGARDDELRAADLADLLAAMQNAPAPTPQAAPAPAPAPVLGDPSFPYAERGFEGNIPRGYGWDSLPVPSFNLTPLKPKRNRR